METTATRHQPHPVFAAIAQSFIDAPAQLKAAQVKAYAALLQKHDWWYDFSEDPAVYQRGRDSLATLRMLQRDLDKDAAIWNAIAPEELRINAAVLAAEQRA